MIREIRKPVPRTPRCEAVLVNEESISYNRHLGKKNPERCGNSSRYEIDGKKFCGKHAGAAALQILLRRAKK